MRGICLILFAVGCNHISGLSLPEDPASRPDIYHPPPFPHVEPNGIQGNWIHITPLGVTTMLWTFRPDGSFEMDVFNATDGNPYQAVPGSYLLDGNRLVLTGPFAGKTSVRMSEELLFQGDEVAAPVFHPDPNLANRWVGIAHIDELDGSGAATSSYDSTDSYLFDANGQVEISVSVEGSVLSSLTSPGGWAAIADAKPLDSTSWDLSLPSVPSWNQLELFDHGSALAAPPMKRTF